jgi:hypothetical protein
VSTEASKVGTPRVQRRSAVVAGRLRKVDDTLTRDAAFLRESTDHPFKVTLPAASWFAAPPAYRAGVTDQVPCMS